MSSKIKNTLIACGGTMLVVLSFVGTIGASLSWFSYSKKVSVTYSGTSISSNKLLQVGIVTDLDLSSNNFTCEEGIAWTLPGAGISPTQLNSYLESSGYATTSLSPATSGKYSSGDMLHLRQSPLDCDRNNQNPAPIDTYVRVPFAFRIINVSDGDYVSNRNVWITESSITGESNEGFNVGNGIRMHFESKIGNNWNRFILNPSKKESGTTQVSGLMDLNNDGFYDYYGDEEIVYGDFSGTPTYSEPLEESTELDDLYNTKATHSYCFCAAHKKGVKKVANLSNLDLGVQEYLTLNEVAPGVDTEGSFKDGVAVTNTGDSKIGFATMIVWAEGWDTSIVDQITKLSFNLSLTFEIDKL